MVMEFGLSFYSFCGFGPPLLFVVPRMIPTFALLKYVSFISVSNMHVDFELRPQIEPQTWWL